MSLQTLKNKAFRVSVQWNALVRKPLSLERGGFTNTRKECDDLFLESMLEVKAFSVFKAVLIYYAVRLFAKVKGLK